MTVVFYIPSECKINQETQGLEIPWHFLKCPNTEFSKFVKSNDGCDIFTLNHLKTQNF